ncbi:MAG: hypothetical protein CMN76_20635 [Spirochaetaceae bacterium]|nr:hypothetical protein [Spirochaetaceae bacterium]|tara:strand:+ start:5622 stop:6485 length:864 start_codon:yes stop_codon:yes gene_type:complete
MWQKIRAILDEKLVRPFRESHAPVHELALGSSIGMFWAMTPLVGIQMYLVTMSWLIMKVVKHRINLAVGLAMVWISNPITMGPMYYAFYKTGYIAFDLLGLNPLVITFENFKAVLDKALSQSLLDGLMTWGAFLLNDLGWPTMVGGVLIATPAAIATYPVTKRMVNRHREKLARKEGLSLEQWEAKHIHTFKEILAIEKQEHLSEQQSMEAARHPEEYLALARPQNAAGAREKPRSKKSTGKKPAKKSTKKASGTRTAKKKSAANTDKKSKKSATRQSNARKKAATN